MGFLLLLAAQASLPAVIVPAGQPTFQDNFASLDAGPDQIKPAIPHRWRTVFGYGGALAVENRTLGETIFVDPTFTGVSNGALGRGSLGLNPFKLGGYGLAITARRVPAGLQRWVLGKSWTSGLLTTRFSFAQLRGYFEMYSDLPTCTKGAWPAFWLLPTSGAWPDQGEIDAPEAIGTGHLFWSTHSGKEATSTQATRAPCARGWHTYGVLWRKDRIGYYYDRKLVASQATPADFKTPMYVLVNLTMEGSWPGKADPSTPMVQMFVNRISVWREQ